MDVTDEKWNGAAEHLTGVSRLVGDDPYELRIAGLDDGEDGNSPSFLFPLRTRPLASSSCPSLLRGEDGWLRVTISSKQRCAVQWMLKFERRHPESSTYDVRRAKAMIVSGCHSRPASAAPVHSDRSGT